MYIHVILNGYHNQVLDSVVERPQCLRPGPGAIKIILKTPIINLILVI